jgi:hypothetical protein
MLTAFAHVNETEGISAVINKINKLHATGSFPLLSQNIIRGIVILRSTQIRRSLT